jgi:antitoxin component YwqK of YwqJK toxin-antitoxin module
MNIDVISEVISHLDINEYEEVGNGLPGREQKRISQYWKRFTTYQVKDYASGKYWYRNGKSHRDGDLPAIVLDNGTKQWYKNDKLHRDGNLPAAEWSNGTKQWWKNNKLHRDGNLPAIEWANSRKEWYKNGKLHRDGDLPVVVLANGTKQ